MKLPVGGRLSDDTNISSAIPLKFVTNPYRIDTEEELFDLLDANSGNPFKYFVIFNPNN